MSSLSLYDAIVRVLSNGATEARLLLDEVGKLRSVSSLVEWRTALVALERAGTVKRDVVRDDDGEVLQVVYALPKRKRGEVTNGKCAA